MNLEDHPTVRRLSRQLQENAHRVSTEMRVDGDWLRILAIECGADDVGLVEIERQGLDPQREEILRNYPSTKSLISFVVRMAREPVRSAPRSVSNLEFHRAGNEVDEISAAIVAKLDEGGVRAVNPSMGSPWPRQSNPAQLSWNADSLTLIAPATCPARSTFRRSS